MTDDSTDGGRGDLTAEIVSRSVINCDGRLGRRLIVADGDGGHAVLVDPAVDLPSGLCAGDRCRFVGLVWCPTDPDPVDGRCGACGGSLREGTPLDYYPAMKAVADRLSVDRVALVPEGGVVAVEGERGVDDWVGMTHDRPPVPDIICSDCGETPRSHADDHAERSYGVQELATPSASAAAELENTVGMATGGAADVSNFRENVRNGYTPQPEALATEGLFYDYHFETGGVAPETDAPFAPRYAAACSDHPLTGETERFLAVGLDSNLPVEAFERPPLDLVAVLDVSGSMDGTFDRYYYDEHGRRREAEAGDETKLEAAVESLCALTEQLDDDDRLGVVLYDNRSHVAKPLRDVGSTDMRAIRGHIRDVSAGGGTNLADGFEAAWELLAGADADAGADRDRERRVVFMTDMMPNTGVTGEDDLTALFADAAADGIHATFVGMGLDENADLADALSGIRGANHYFVTSGAEFRRRLGEEFDYMVTPLVYDLALDVEADGYEVAAVHGSPTASAADGRLVHVGTLFPSPKEDGRTRGGIVLVELADAGAAGDCELVASWTGRDGETRTQRVTVELPAEPETFDDDGVRKAVALARYAGTLRNWARAVRRGEAASTAVDDWLLPDDRGEHERESVPLAVPEGWADRFDAVRASLAETRAAVGDDDLRQELELLDELRAAAGSEAERGREATD